MSNDRTQHQKTDHKSILSNCKRARIYFASHAVNTGAKFSAIRIYLGSKCYVSVGERYVSVKECNVSVCECYARVLECYVSAWECCVCEWEYCLNA